MLIGLNYRSKLTVKAVEHLALKIMTGESINLKFFSSSQAVTKTARLREYGYALQTVKSLEEHNNNKHKFHARASTVV